MPRPDSPLNNIPTNRHFQVRPPTFKTDDVIGRLKVIKYVGRPFLGDTETVEHSYLTICTCGELRTVTQGYLKTKRSNPMCKSCAKKHQKEIAKKSKKLNEAKKSTSTLTPQDVASLKW